MWVLRSINNVMLMHVINRVMKTLMITSNDHNYVGTYIEGIISVSGPF